MKAISTLKGLISAVAQSVLILPNLFDRVDWGDRNKKFCAFRINSQTTSRGGFNQFTASGIYQNQGI